MEYYSESRMKRALCQPMFLINAEYNLNDDWIFEVQGYSGSNYEISISPLVMKCNCPDFKQREKICKHLYFIIGRVANDTKSIQKLKDNNIFTINNSFSQILNQRLKSRLEIKQVFEEDCDSDCVICFEVLKESKHITKCKTCNNKFHSNCLQRWLANKQSCPLCRSNITIDQSQLSQDSLAHFNNLVINNSV